MYFMIKKNDLQFCLTFKFPSKVSQEHAHHWGIRPLFYSNRVEYLSVKKYRHAIIKLFWGQTLQQCHLILQLQVSKAGNVLGKLDDSS